MAASVFLFIHINFYINCIGLGDGKLTLGILKNCFPLLNKNYWYFNAYFAVMLFAPYLHRGIIQLNNKQMNELFIVILIFFSFVAIIEDPFALNYGYSPIWLLILFVLGDLMKSMEFFKKKNMVLYLMIILVSAVINISMYIFFHWGVLNYYISPVLLLPSISYVAIFSKLEIKNNKLVKLLSPLAFGAYLCQENPYVKRIIIFGKSGFILNFNVIVGMIVVVITSALITLFCMLVEFIRQQLFIKAEKSLAMRFQDFVNNKLLVKL